MHVMDRLTFSRGIAHQHRPVKGLPSHRILEKPLQTPRHQPPRRRQNAPHSVHESARRGGNGAAAQNNRR